MGNAGVAGRRSAVTTLPRPLLAICQRRFASCRPPTVFPGDDRRHASKVATPRGRVSAADSVPNAITDILAALGIDVERVRRRCPAVLKYDVTRLHAMLQFFSTSNLDPAKLLNKYPQILQLKLDVLASNLTFLQTLPINANKAVESCPVLLYLPPKTIQSKLDMFGRLGLPAEMMIKRHSSIFARSDEAIRRKLAFLELLGLDAKHIVTQFPPVVGLTDRHIRSKFNYLSDMGLDARRIFNAKPQVISMDIERKLRPTIEFITKDMGYSLAEISKNPSCFTYSIEQRIKPRHRYMMAHGKRKDYALSTLFHSTDKAFTWLVDRHPVEHYHQWRESVHS
jgi:hypothetical protein